MIETHSDEKLTWVDVASPSNDEIRELLETYELPPSLLGDLLSATPHSYAVAEDKVLKVTLDFPTVKRDDVDHPHEMKFIVTGNTLISIRYEEIEAVDRFKKEFEVISTLYKTKKGANGVHLFYGLLGQFHTSLGSMLDYLDTKLTDIEQEIFNEHEKEMVFAISEASRRLISFRLVLKSHEDVLRSLKALIEENANKTTAEGLAESINQYYFLMRRANGLFETLDELRETNFALLTTKQNEIMKILTIMAFVTFPLSLFASLFGMNTLTLPLTGFAGDFWIILSIMVFLTACFFVFFKYKRWI